MKKLNELNKNGINCFEYKYNSPFNIKDFKKQNNIKTIAGRLIFFDNNEGIISDYTGELKFKFNLIKNTYNNIIIKNLDIGDIIGLKLNKKNGNFIAKEIKILTKTLFPIDFNVKEKNYKYKYLNFIKNKFLAEIIVKRALLFKILREELNNNNFIEIDTPILHPFQGDSTAKPLFTKVTSYNSKFALASSPELYLKKMLVAGFNRVFTISKVFRDEKIDNTHLFEFTTVEYYMAYVDYNFMMDFTENLIKSIVNKIGNSNKNINFNSKWNRISMYKKLKDKFGFDIYNADNETLLKIAKENNILYKKTVSNGNIIIDLFEKLFIKNLKEPTFVYDFPNDASVMCYDITMAKSKLNNPNILERFELYINGIEIANCYSELNEPETQKKYFNNFIKGSGKKLKMDDTFYQALKTGMPPASGVGFGIDRLLMLINDIKHIDDTTPFSPYYENL